MATMWGLRSLTVYIAQSTQARVREAVEAALADERHVAEEAMRRVNDALSAAQTKSVCARVLDVGGGGALLMLWMTSACMFLPIRLF